MRSRNQIFIAVIYALTLFAGCKKASDQPSAGATGVAESQKGEQDRQEAQEAVQDQPEAVSSEPTGRPTAHEKDPAAGRPAAGEVAEEGFRLSWKAPRNPKSGNLTATVALAPVAPYKVNVEYPLKLTLGGSSNAAPQIKEMGPQDADSFDEKGAILRPRFTLKGGGQHQLNGTLKFSICNESQCLLKTKKVTWAVEATP